jgi:hypothetical protein
MDGHDKLTANTSKHSWPVVLHRYTSTIMQTMGSEVYAAYVQKMGTAQSLDYFQLFQLQFIQLTYLLGTYECPLSPSVST